MPRPFPSHPLYLGSLPKFYRHIQQWVLAFSVVSAGQVPARGSRLTGPCPVRAKRGPSGVGLVCAAQLVGCSEDTLTIRCPLRYLS